MSSFLPVADLHRSENYVKQAFQRCFAQFYCQRWDYTLILGRSKPSVLLCYKKIDHWNYFWNNSSETNLNGTIPLQ